jgi:hypothetical protein
MHTDSFSTQVMPQIVAAWERSCLCRSPGFLKLMSFDFRNYGHSPRALYDVERIGYEIIERRFVAVSNWVDVGHGGAQKSVRSCPQCGTRCTRTWEQFNIHFDCTCFNFDGSAVLAEMGLYLVGFYWLGEPCATPDFRQAASVEEFFAALAS